MEDSERERKLVYLKKTLRRLLDETSLAQERKDYSSWHGIKKHLNDTLQLANELHPTNEILKKIDTTHVVMEFGSPFDSSNLSNIRLKILHIADAIDIDFEEINKIASPHQVININTNQLTNQYNQQNLENVLNQLSLTNTARTQIEEKKEEYDKLQMSPSPDKDKIRSVIKQILLLSKEVGIVILKHALERGLILPTDILK